jgi:hypothetical protein
MDRFNFLFSNIPGTPPMPRFWPLLLIIIVLAVVCLFLTPKNLAIVPYKLLGFAISVYGAHKVDRVFFKRGGDDMPRAVVYAATIIGLAMWL